MQNNDNLVYCQSTCCVFRKLLIKHIKKSPPKTLIARLDDELHMLGPKAISDDVFCLTMLRNTGRQRLDDPDTQLVQYFILYNTVMRRIT